MKIKIIFKYLLFIILVSSLILLYSFTFKRNSNKKVEGIFVEFEKSSSNFLTQKMVNKLISQNGFKLNNKTKSDINLYELENKVYSSPYVEKATVYLTVDGLLKATIKQREPLARIISKNKVYYIDKQGVKIPLSKNYSARVLLVSEIKSDKEIKKILPLIKYIQRDKFLKKEIVGIEKINKKEYQLYVRSGDYKISFGGITKIDVKFKKLKAFYNTAFKNRMIKKYKVINLKYKNQIVCQK